MYSLNLLTHEDCFQTLNRSGKFKETVSGIEKYMPILISLAEELVSCHNGIGDIEKR